MVKFAKEFRGVKAGDIYPTVFAKDEECPPELEQAAAELGALEASGSAENPAETQPELEQAAAESKAPATSGKKKNEGK